MSEQERAPGDEEEQGIRTGAYLDIRYILNAFAIVKKTKSGNGDKKQTHAMLAENEIHRCSSINVSFRTFVRAS